MTPAETWHDALRRARNLDPDRIARAIVEHTNTGMRATTYDRDGGRTAAVECVDEWCEDGPASHSHPTTPDPTGNAALGAHHDTRDQAELNQACQDFVAHANVVLDYVAGKHATTWTEVLRLNASLMPGTIQAGLDVDHERVLPSAISVTARAVERVSRLAAAHLPREPSTDERHWTAGLADEDCCAWHLLVEPRGAYRRPRAEGKNVCADCVALVLAAEGDRPPAWLLEAEVERLAKPRQWTQALGRWLEGPSAPDHDGVTYPQPFDVPRPGVRHG